MLEAEVAQRASLEEVLQSAWLMHGPPPAHEASALEKARPTLGRQGYASMMQLGRAPRPVGVHDASAEVGLPTLTQTLPEPEPEPELEPEPEPDPDA